MTAVYFLAGIVVGATAVALLGLLLVVGHGGEE